MAEKISSKDGGSPTGLVLGLFAFSAYLLAGSYYGLTRAKWPFFMPPQLDLFGLLFGLFGEHAGGYVGGGLLGLLGLASAICGVVILVRSNV
jgi:hypothetical protein